MDQEQQVVALLSGVRDPKSGEGQGISCRLNLHLDASATMCLVNRGGLGKAKYVDMQSLWIQEASKSGWFATKKVDTSANPADLMTKPIPKARIEQLMSFMGTCSGAPRPARQKAR